MEELKFCSWTFLRLFNITNANICNKTNASVEKKNHLLTMIMVCVLTVLRRVRM